LRRAQHRAPGVLLAYHRPVSRQFVDAANVDENIASFGRHSRFRVWELNTDLGFPPGLAEYEFDAIFVHYSVLVPGPAHALPPRFLEYLQRSSAYKLASFQDEYHWCGRRFEFIDDFGIDCVYTLLEPEYVDQVYGTRTKAWRVVSNFPAYVGAELLDSAERFALPEEERSIDVGYRGRPMAPYAGRGGLEKTEIGDRFAELAGGSGLTLDIGTREEDRLYGDDWPRFVAASRGTLGVESGASCFDLEDEVREEYERLSADGREVTVEELERGALGRWDGRIPYRTVSPRNFEAAAFRVCQVLYEGHYSGVMKPMEHYIPLRKDFSNLDEVLERFGDPDLRSTLIENAHRDLIASGAYGYEPLIREFDQVLLDAGLSPDRPPEDTAAVERSLRHSAWQRSVGWVQGALNWLRITHPRIWWPVWFVSRPVAVPLRLARRALSR
jgi:hypothetical protein